MIFDILKFLTGKQTTINYKDLLSQGALIVDVRTPGEYHSGHIPGSLNIPLNKLGENITSLKKKKKPVITCCASGVRSGSAASLLRSEGFTDVYNGGSWQTLNAKIK